MATKKQILRLLTENEVPAVLVGGLALRIYNSPRVTHDMALAIRSLDTVRVAELLYGLGCRLVCEVGERDAQLPLSASDAVAWVEAGGVSSMTFVECAVLSSHVSFAEIDIATQVDFLFDLAVPVMRLRERARAVAVDDFEILVASPQDLLELKRAREDQSPADLADIAFLERLIAADAGRA